MLNQFAQKQKRRWWNILLIIPFLILFWPPIYNLQEPLLFGIPFFYWFQMLMIVVGAGLTAVVYFLTK